MKQSPIVPADVPASPPAMNVPQSGDGAVAGHASGSNPRGRVLVVGGANLDITAQSSANLLPGDSNPGRIGFSLGGVARNVAENLARLKLGVDLLTLLGDDAAGQRIAAAAHALGIDTSATRLVEGGTTPCYLSVHGADGDMAVAVNDMGLLDRLTPSHLRRYSAHFERAAYVFADCNLSEETLVALVRESNSKPVAVDTVSAAKCSRVLPVLDRLDLLKLNALEAQTLTGTPVESVQDALVAVRQLQERGVRHVVISLGALGAVWCDASGVAGHMPSPSVKVVNTSGAGDALMSGLVYGRLHDWPMHKSVEWGMACAALTLASPHANAQTLCIQSVNEITIAAAMP